MLTITGSHNSRQIFCEVCILPVESLDGFGDIDTHAPRNLNIQTLTALIDTGATNTCITASAAQKIGLDPLGEMPTMGVHGINSTRFYQFRIGFFQYESGELGSSSDFKVSILKEPIKGTELGFDTAPFDVLLGMDVISHGDLHIGQNGRVEFIFQTEQTACY